MVLDAICEVEDRVMGGGGTVDKPSGNIDRSMRSTAGWPGSKPSTAVNRRCGSSEVAIRIGLGEFVSRTFDIACACAARIGTTLPHGVQRRGADARLQAIGIAGDPGAATVPEYVA